MEPSKCCSPMPDSAPGAPDRLERAASDVTVGILGSGRMGSGIALRLLSAGYRVTVFDVDSDAADALRPAGAAVARSAPELAAAADVLITVLPGPTECRAAMLGEAETVGVGALKSMRRGSCWLDFTSNDPRVAREIAAAAADLGVLSVSAPMAGGPENAGNGGLRFSVSGESLAVAQVTPLLAALGGPDAVTYVGADVGGAHVVKLLSNTLWFGQVIAVTEALLIAQAEGLDIRTAKDALASGPGSSAFVTDYLDALLAGDYLETFGLDRVVEELQTVCSLAEVHSLPAENILLVLRHHEAALDRFGPVAGELLGARLLEERANTVVRAPDPHPENGLEG